MKIENCNFPDTYLYDTQNFVWADLEFANTQNNSLDNYVIARVGIMPILSYISGNINKIKLKSEGECVNKDKSLGTLESLSYFGVIRSPISGKIVEINKSLLHNPKIVNDSPFEFGWIAKIKSSDASDFETLQPIDKCKDELSLLVKKYNVKCFKSFPDYEMYELGTECSATLAKLGDFIGLKMNTGQVVHLVSDDPTADLEVSRWAIDNNQELVEVIMEKNEIKFSNKMNYLFHILVKKLN
jgi:glycine cleavage system H lipoate-binding protein/TusA-related sulfurtransferase